MVIVGEFKLCLCTQGSVYDTSHLTTLDDDIHIGIHGTLVVSGKDDTGIVIVGSGLFGLIRHGNLSRLIVLVVPCSVDIHRNGTFDRQIWRSHHTIQLITIGVLGDSLTTTHADGRIESRFDGDAESLFAMRHGFFEGFDIRWVVQRIEATIVAETAEYLHRCGYGTINGTIIDSIIFETFHLDTFTHLQVVVLAEDVLIGVCSAGCILKGDILKAGISPKWEALIETGNLDGTAFFIILIFAGDGHVTEKWRILLGIVPFFFGKNITSDIIVCNIETGSLVIGNILVAFTHQYDDVLIP